MVIILNYYFHKIQSLNLIPKLKLKELNTKKPLDWGVNSKVPFIYIYNGHIFLLYFELIK